MTEMPTIARRPVRRRTTMRAEPLPHALLADAEIASDDIRVAELLSAGFRVSLARTAFEAIVKASCQVPDLILFGALRDMEIEVATDLLTTCPVTAHIPIVRLTPGRRMPRRRLVQMCRAAS